MKHHNLPCEVTVNSFLKFVKGDIQKRSSGGILGLMGFIKIVVLTYIRVTK